ncbi:MAG: glycerol-3-phosphate 1-O-acyltransferase PlsY [Actinomycetota bacterium]
MAIVKSILAIVAGYLLGSIPFGLIMGKIGYGIDIREFGSGNVGATNVFRVLGTLPGLLVLVGDFLKGALSLLLASYLFPNAPTFLGSHEQVVLTDATVVVLAGMAAILGHSWSIYLKFLGGKGVATGAGVLTVLAPNVAGILFLIWLLIVISTRYVSLASITIAFLLPLLMLYFQAGNYPYILFSILATIIIVYKHKPNIKRLLAGEELKLGFRSQEREGK